MRRITPEKQFLAVGMAIVMLLSAAPVQNVSAAEEYKYEAEILPETKDTLFSETEEQILPEAEEPTSQDAGVPADVTVDIVEAVDSEDGPFREDEASFLPDDFSEDWPEEIETEDLIEDFEEDSQVEDFEEDSQVEDFEEDSQVEETLPQGDGELHNVIVTGPDGRTNKTYANMEDGGLCGTQEAGAVWLYANGVLTIRPWVDSHEKETDDNLKQENLLMQMDDREMGDSSPWHAYDSLITKVVLEREYCKGIRIGAYAFYGLSVLEFVEWEESTDITISIGVHAFEQDEALTQMPVFYRLEQLEDYAFAGCTALREIVFAGNVPGEGLEVFHGDTLTISASGRYADVVTALADNSTDSSITRNLTDMYCGENLTWSLDENGTLTISGDGPMTDYASGEDAPWALAKKYIRKIVFQEYADDKGISIIGAHAFASCSHWDGNVTVPESVREIHRGAFMARPAGYVTFTGAPPEIEEPFIDWTSIDPTSYDWNAPHPEYNIFIADEYTRFALPLNWEELGWENGRSYFSNAIETPEYYPKALMWIYAAEDYHCSPSANGTAFWNLTLDGQLYIRGEGSTVCGWDEAYKPLIREAFTEEGITYLGEGTFADCPKLIGLDTYATGACYEAFRGSPELRRISVLPGSDGSRTDKFGNFLFIYQGRMLCSGHVEQGQEYSEDKITSIIYPIKYGGSTFDLRECYAGETLDLVVFSENPDIKEVIVPGNVALRFSGTDSDTDLSSEVTFTVFGEENSPAEEFCEAHNIPFDYVSSWNPNDKTGHNNDDYIPNVEILHSNISGLQEGVNIIFNSGGGGGGIDEEDINNYRDASFRFQPEEAGTYRFYMRQSNAEYGDTEPQFRVFSTDGNDEVILRGRSDRVTVINTHSESNPYELPAEDNEETLEQYAFADMYLEPYDPVYLYTFYNERLYTLVTGVEKVEEEPAPEFYDPVVSGICGECTLDKEGDAYICSARKYSSVTITIATENADYGTVRYYWNSTDPSADMGLTETIECRLDPLNSSQRVSCCPCFGTLDGGKLMLRKSITVKVNLIGGTTADTAVPVRHTTSFPCFGMGDNDGLDMYVGNSFTDPNTGEVWFSFTPDLSGTYYLRSGYAEYENGELTVDPYGEILDELGNVVLRDGAPLQNNTAPEGMHRYECYEHETENRDRKGKDCYATFEDDFYIETHLNWGTTYYIRCVDQINSSGGAVPVRIYMFRDYDYTKELSWNFGNSRAAFGYTDGVENFDFNPYKRIWGNTPFAQQCYKDWKDRQWSGNCFGMSAAAMLLRDENSDISPADFGASEDGVSELYLASRGKAGTAAEGLMAQELIEMMQVAQFSPAIEAILQKNMNNTGGLLEAMEEAQDAGKPLLIAWYGDRWGHAVIGYRLADDRLYIIDPNHPQYGCHLKIRRGSANSEKWELGTGATNDSYYNIGSNISYLPYEEIRSIWDNRSRVKNGSQGYLRVDRSNMLSIYSGNTLIGKIENGVFTAVPGSFAENGIGIFELQFMDGNGEQDDIAYICVPADREYRIEQTGASGVSGTGFMDVALMNDDRVVTVETQADAVTLKASDGSGECYAKIEGKENDTYTVNITDGSAGEDAQKEITLEGAAESFANSQQEAVVLDASGGTVKTANAGGATLSENGKTMTIPSEKKPSSDQTKQKAFISVNAKTVKLKKGQTTTGLVVSMADWDSVKSVKATKKGIVKVSVKDAKKGIIKLKGKKTGSSKVTITLQSGLSVTVKVKVQKKKVTAKKVLVSSAASNSNVVADALSGKILKLKKGQSFRMKIMLDPFTAQDKITYRSSKPKVAAVTKKGIVKAKKAGKAKITIRAGKKNKVLTVVVSGA